MLFVIIAQFVTKPLIDEMWEEMEVVDAEVEEGEVEEGEADEHDLRVLN